MTFDLHRVLGEFLYEVFVVQFDWWVILGFVAQLMFTGRFADEATLFRLAAQLEKEAPWKDRRPAVWG